MFGPLLTLADICLDMILLSSANFFQKIVQKIA